MFKLEENEKLIAVFRKHTFYIMTEISGIMLIAIIPFFIYQFLKPLVLEQLSLEVNYFFLFIYFIFLTILWIISFIKWTDYYLDTWILTDKRLVDIEQKGLFSREISSLRLDKIQDIKLEVSGLIQTFMNIGSVNVQSAGTEKEFIIRNAKGSNHIKELILDAHNKQVDEIKTVRVENPNIS